MKSRMSSGIFLPREAMKSRLASASKCERPAYAAVLGFAGRVCRIETNSPRLAELACEFFPCPAIRSLDAFEAGIALEVRRPRPAYAAALFPVFRGRGAFVHADYGAHGSVWFDLKARKVSGFISHELLDDTELFQRSVLAVIAGVLAPAVGVVGIHAGCVVRDGKAVLLAAPSGAGKSTTTLALALRGWSLLSDDWTYVTSTGSGLRAWGMKTSLKLLPDAMRFFPQLSTLTAGLSLNGELALEFDPWRMFHLDRAVDAAPTAIVLIDRNSWNPPASGCHIGHAGREETSCTLLADIEEQPAEVVREGHSALEAIDQLAGLPAVHALLGGEPASAAAVLDEFLRERIHD